MEAWNSVTKLSENTWEISLVKTFKIGMSTVPTQCIVTIHPYIQLRGSSRMK